MKKRSSPSDLWWILNQLIRPFEFPKSTEQKNIDVLVNIFMKKQLPYKKIIENVYFMYQIISQ